MLLIITIIKVFVKHKIVSVETILKHMHTRARAHTHIGTSAHEHTDYTKLNLHTT